MLLTTETAITPHGGELIDRVVPEEEIRERSMEAAELPKVPLSPRALSDLQMISTGVFSPLEGFMLRDEYEGVVEDMRLQSGLAWSLPVTVSVDEEQAGGLSEGSEVALVDGSGEPVATMVLREMYGYDKEREARIVYRTTDAAHPGVAAVYRQGDVLLGGEVELLRPPDEGRFP
ncbi:MAG: sulfate adenylyltransferase, partial [Rubrobacteraceae bacterium]|nr:sulfate adenylyltransferase [Rubrobacteraceae bacterium]